MQNQTSVTVYWDSKQTDVGLSYSVYKQKTGPENMLYINCALQRQTAVTAHLKSTQLLLFVFAHHNYDYACTDNVAQRQTAVTAHLKSEQLLFLVLCIWIRILFHLPINKAR